MTGATVIPPPVTSKALRAIGAMPSRDGGVNLSFSFFFVSLFLSLLSIDVKAMEEEPHTPTRLKLDFTDLSPFFFLSPSFGGDGRVRLAITFAITENGVVSIFPPLPSFRRQR